MKRRPSTALLRPLRERLHRAPQFRGRRQVVQLTWIAIDVLAMLAAAHLVSDVLHRPMTGAVWQAFGIAVAVRIAAFIRFGMYRAALRYSGVHVLAITVTGIGLGSAVGLAAGWIGGNLGTLGLGRAFVLFEALVSMALCGGLRFAAGLVLEPRWSEGAEPVLIYGAGDFGEATLRNLGRHGSYRPVGLLDDAPHKHGLTIHGRRVLGGLAQLPAILERTHPTAVFVAITDLRDETARTIARACQAAGVYVYLVRSVDASRGSLRLRDLPLEDLLPRPSRKLDPEPVRAMLAGRTVLGTGRVVRSALSCAVRPPPLVPPNWCCWTIANSISTRSRPSSTAAIRKCGPWPCSTICTMPNVCDGMKSCSNRRWANREDLVNVPLGTRECLQRARAAEGPKVR
jgi:PglD N-terminal domain